MKEVIRVGMADYKICHSPQVISTLGLGSCLGVVLYDETTQICGLAHVMLPDSSRMTRDINRMKFVDTCLEDMYQDLLQHNVQTTNLVAKVAGGAKMFSHHSRNEILNIGEQNVTAVKAKLKEWQIPILAEDTGKDYSRTIRFSPQTGMLSIKAIGIGEYII